MTWIDRFLPWRKTSYNLGMIKGYLTTKEAAERLGRSEQAIRDLIKRGRLKAERFGPVWMLHEEEIENFKPAKMGRPRKET